MGCCNIKPTEAEIVTESVVEITEFTPNISFADVSLRSNEEESEKNLPKEDSSHYIVRPRSTSCSTLLFCNHIEKAFLVTSPNKIFNTGSNSCRERPCLDSFDVVSSAVNNNFLQVPDKKFYPTIKEIRQGESYKSV